MKVANVTEYKLYTRISPKLILTLILQDPCYSYSHFINCKQD
jgi:hypothetical protein